MLESIIEKVKNFRQGIYDLLPKRADSTMDLLDALSSNTNADSVVKMSLSPLFRRCYSSVFDTIENFSCVYEATESNKNGKDVAQPEANNNQQDLLQLIGKQCPGPTPERPFRLFGLDCTSGARPYAAKLADRHVVYSPNPTPGNKPIVIGHQYSTVACLPHHSANGIPSWVLPCSTERVPSGEHGNEHGMKQLSQLLKHTGLNWNNELSVGVGDSLYSTIKCQRLAKPHGQLVMIARVRNNRTVYGPPSQKETGNAGHPTWYGPKMNLKQTQTHLPADEHQQFEMCTRTGKPIIVTIDVWQDMRTTGKRDFRTDQYPFTLLRVTITTPDGKCLYQRPLWLAVFGKQRHALSPQVAYECFRQRYDLEHYFRFGKQRLLMNRFQTPVAKHEENWWQLAQLAYVQLYVARELAVPTTYDWERYLPKQRQSTISSPSQTLRNFASILSMVGTPAVSPTKRGHAAGRSSGECPSPRPDIPVIYKNTKNSKKDPQKTPNKGETLGSEQTTFLAKPTNYSDVLYELQRMVKQINMTMEEFIGKTVVGLAT